MSQCSTAVSNCWSVGEPDWDCADNGLCCFDGCANTCLGSAPAAALSPAAQPAPEKQSQAPAPAPPVDNGLLFPPPNVGYNNVADDSIPQQSGAPGPSKSQPSAPAPAPSRPRPAPAPQAAPTRPARTNQNIPRRPKPSGSNSLSNSQAQQVTGCYIILAFILPYFNF